MVDVPYDALDAEVGKLLAEYDGFFITKPYKNDVKRFLKSYPANCGVNFVSCADGRGYNTDGIGFMRALEASFGKVDGKIKSALVLGRWWPLRSRRGRRGALGVRSAHSSGHKRVCAQQNGAHCCKDVHGART